MDRAVSVAEESGSALDEVAANFPSVAVSCSSVCWIVLRNWAIFEARAVGVELWLLGVVRGLKGLVEAAEDRRWGVGCKEAGLGVDVGEDMVGRVGL